MQSLKVRGYVEQPMSGGLHRLGVQCLLLARGPAGRHRPDRPRAAALRELVDAFDESGYLAIVRGGRGIFVEVTETRRRELRLVGPLGAVVHYHATAAGKVIAANLPPIARGALLVAPAARQADGPHACASRRCRGGVGGCAAPRLRHQRRRDHRRRRLPRRAGVRRGAGGVWRYQPGRAEGAAIRRRWAAASRRNSWSRARGCRRRWQTRATCTRIGNCTIWVELTDTVA